MLTMEYEVQCDEAPFFYVLSKPGLGETADHPSSARLGRLKMSGRKSLETPNFLALSSRGVVPHITPDVMIKHTKFDGVYMALEDFIERAPTGTPPIVKCTSKRGSPLHTFTALHSSLFTVLAPRRTPAVPAPTGNSNDAISIFTSVGFYPLTTALYSQYVQTLRPDIAISLADIPFRQPPGVKRVAKMADRTSEWLDALISDSRSHESAEKSQPAIFAPILPIDFHDQSEYLHHIADDLPDSISGLAFYSSSLLPDIPATTAISRLPRLSLDEPSSPHQLLREISLGIDIFTIPFVGFATDAGLGFIFQFPPPAATSLEETRHRVKPLAMDLFSSALATTVAPIIQGCSCYTCTAHHTAYITHLLSAKEMLGWVLLQIHNHHVMSEFFAAIRVSITAGTFESDREVFETYYESDLPEGTGEKPRVRGYHFKSEGPGQARKNKPAWGNLGGADSPLVPDESSKELEDKGFAEPVDQ
ncbi:MAG: hypothetical protein M1818_002358 [Claussenomyces sp. TS43310]|nr:MAG: hypothetical protein M1818_002358 [Claussenomyces sp. TS43310]